MSLIWCGLFVVWVQTGEFDLRRMAPELHDVEARSSFAVLAGGRLGPLSDRVVGGIVVPSAISTDPNRLYADLLAWCQITGWAVTPDEENRSLTLRKNGHHVTVAPGQSAVNFGPQIMSLPVERKVFVGVPFARRQVVQYNNWTGMSDVVMVRDDRVMVPSDVLDGLVKLIHPPTDRRRPRIWGL